MSYNIIFKNGIARLAKDIHLGFSVLPLTLKLISFLEFEMDTQWNLSCSSVRLYFCIYKRMFSGRLFHWTTRELKFIWQITDLISDISVLNGLTPSSFSNHSILRILCFKLPAYVDGLNMSNAHEYEQNIRFDKFSLKEIPFNFLSSETVVNTLLATVFNLKQRRIE